MPTAFSSDRERPGEALGQRLVAAAPEREHRRPDRERRLQTGDAAALLVDADPERQLVGKRLRVARDLRHLLGCDDVAGEEDDAAEIELTCERAQVGRNGRAPANPAIASWPMWRRISRRDM